MIKLVIILLIGIVALPAAAIESVALPHIPHDLIKQYSRDCRPKLIIQGEEKTDFRNRIRMIEEWFECFQDPDITSDLIRIQWLIMDQTITGLRSMIENVDALNKSDIPCRSARDCLTQAVNHQYERAVDWVTANEVLEKSIRDKKKVEKRSSDIQKKIKELENLETELKKTMDGFRSD